MSGYAIEPNLNKSILVSEPDTIDELYGRVLYGIKFDPDTGKTILEIVGEDDPIILPQTGSTNDSDYAHWFASSKLINLVWREETTNKGHLFMEVA